MRENANVVIVMAIAQFTVLCTSEVHPQFALPFIYLDISFFLRVFKTYVQQTPDVLFPFQR